MDDSSRAGTRFTELMDQIADAHAYMARTAGVLEQIAEGEWDDHLDDAAAGKLARRVRAMAETVRLTRAEAAGEYADEYPRWPDASRGLPVNRKERFWTGTVLPAIIATPLFLNLDLFLELCGLPGIAVGRDGGPVELYTEYNLTESTFSEYDRARLRDVPSGGDTPDLIIIGQDNSGGERWLLAVEAKMFHTPGQAALADQLRRQKVVIDYLRETFDIPADATRHLLLVPAKLPTGELPRVTWERVLAIYDGIAPAYWTSLLHRALDQYDQLRSAPALGGANAEARLTGGQIVAAHADGTLGYAYVGRRGGLNGAEFTADVETGRWRQTSYQVRTDPLENPNWMPVSDFLAQTATSHSA